MPTKKNRDGSGHPDFPVRSLADNLDQPSGFGNARRPHDYLYNNIQGGTAVSGGGSSKVGRLSHGTDTPNKVSLPKHSGKKTKGLYPKASS